MGLIKRITDYFASYTEVTNSNSIQSNPLSKAVEDMNAKPKYKTVDGYEYLAFGRNDDVDLMIDKMSYKSATHSGIIAKKSKMITGVGIEAVTEKIGQKKAKIDALMKHAGGTNIPLYRILTQAAFEYTRSGAVGLLINFGEPKDATKKVPDGIVTIKAIPSRNMRFERTTDDSTDFTHMIIKKSFKGGGNIAEAQRVPLFNPNSGETIQLLYIKNPYTILDSYGLPNWIGAFHFIESDYEFGVQIENSSKNGFAPKVHVAMSGRNMSKEERKKAAGNIQTRLSGSEGDQVVVSFVGKMEEAPDITSLDISNLDKTIDIMARLNDSKILTSHNITSPALFGIVTAGSIGGSGTEIISAYNLFKATETMPDREVLLTEFANIFDATELSGTTFEIVEPIVDVLYKTKPTEDGNTTDNPNTTTGTVTEETSTNLKTA